MTIHVVGAGLAGLAAAITAAAAGQDVALIEAAPQAGGRCRSIDDPLLDRRIDNGSHVLIGANPAAMAFLDQIGARDSIVQLGEGGAPFVDLATGERWLFRAGRPVPGAGLREHLAALRLIPPCDDRTVADLLGHGTLMRRFWGPLTVSALNTAPQRASACLLRRIMGEILRHGRAGLDLFMAREGLSDSFVEPALRYLGAHGATVRYGRPVQNLVCIDDRVESLALGDQTLELAKSDRVVLAIPPAAIQRLLPDVTVPEGSNAIVNAHFRVAPALLGPGAVPLIGLCGGTAQWLFQRGDVLSVTVSDANALLADGHEAIAVKLWRDVAAALDLQEVSLPPFRVVREKRATFDQTPVNETRRPHARTALTNLFLAGDWTATGLPATIESAVRSGRRAAQLALTR